jgi:hypothetical protein
VKSDTLTEIYTPTVLREIERTLSEPLFHGIPIGQTLNDVLIIGLLTKRLHLNHNKLWMTYARMIYHSIRIHWPKKKAALPSARPFLVTCLSASSRIRELMLPVVDALGRDLCIVACAGPTLSFEISDLCDVDWKQALPKAPNLWRKEYLKCLPQWSKKLRCLCQKNRLPKGTYELLTLSMLYSTQNVAGCIALLDAWSPSIIVTEYDRNSYWSCLVLAAKALGIPTVTLVHGVMNENAVGYTPVLADKIICWGSLQKETLIGEGENPEKILVAGCPRLTRELPLTAEQVRVKMGFDSKKSAIMLATSPINPKILEKTVSAFCIAAEKAGNWSAFVRLHPSEKIATYLNMAKKHPSVRFFENATFSLEDALAAIDVVVVQNSGMGGDALVKGKLVVVLSMDGPPLGYGAELVNNAGCALARSADELLTEVEQLLYDKSRNQNAHVMAEIYVNNFCTAYGKDAAAKIAEILESMNKQ